MNAAPGPVSFGRPVSVTEHRSAPCGAESETLTALLAGTADGDVSAFAALYDHTCSRTYGVALRVLHVPGFAQETTQEVYLQVWTTADRFDPARGSVQAWLTTLTHRRAVDRVRSERAHTRRVLIYHNGNRVDGRDDVIDEVLGGLERSKVSAGVATLTKPRREAIALAYYGGLTYSQVAEHLEVTCLPSNLESEPD